MASDSASVSYYEVYLGTLEIDPEATDIWEIPQSDEDYFWKHIEDLPDPWTDFMGAGIWTEPDWEQDEPFMTRRLLLGRFWTYDEAEAVVTIARDAGMGEAQIVEQSFPVDPVPSDSGTWYTGSMPAAEYEFNTNYYQTGVFLVQLAEEQMGPPLLVGQYTWIRKFWFTWDLQLISVDEAARRVYYQSEGGFYSRDLDESPQPEFGRIEATEPEDEEAIRLLFPETDPTRMIVMATARDGLVWYWSPLGPDDEPLGPEGCAEEEGQITQVRVHRGPEGWELTHEEELFSGERAYLLPFLTQIEPSPYGFECPELAIDGI